jgi:hypothetical protein
MTKRKTITATIILISTFLLGGAGTIITIIFNLHNEFPVLFVIVAFLPLLGISRIASYVVKRFAIQMDA